MKEGALLAAPQPAAQGLRLPSGPIRRLQPLPLGPLAGPGKWTCMFLFLKVTVRTISLSLPSLCSLPIKHLTASLKLLS